jgi:hypothetical protein
MPGEDDRRYANVLDSHIIEKSASSQSWHQNMAPKTEVIDSQEEYRTFPLIDHQLTGLPASQ